MRSDEGKFPSPIEEGGNGPMLSSAISASENKLNKIELFELNY